MHCSEDMPMIEAVSHTTDKASSWVEPARRSRDISDHLFAPALLFTFNVYNGIRYPI
jgi:hypothetical protein